MPATVGRLPANAEGRYYVTDECNGCGICVSFAPDNFGDPQGSVYVVLRQPQGDEELAVRDAMEACPVGCIKDDGGR